MEDTNSVIEKWLAPAFKDLKEHPEIHKWIRDMAFAVYRDLSGLAPSHAEFAGVYAGKAGRCFDDNFAAVESQIKKLDENYEIACGKGCDMCCHSHITALPHEIFLIAEMLIKILDESELEALLVEIKSGAEEYEEKGFKKFALEYFRPCPFLRDNTCVIYEVRPLTCRNWISHDLSACKASFKSRNKIPVPQNAVLMHQKDVLFAGHNAALSAKGINGNLCSLLPTLSAVLEDYTGCYINWLNGEKMYGQMEDL
ncbi:YkgJ family cysteine cluster protein [Maridesulfovibrio bastinii]|uniref:YkgJ family cysteine cluster protein n=1 Tax=Maridesulfovibrio bastinii TaxID=47157 RepID=UPI0003F57CAE|nr:YkgJ family cysteine cluster protein [Maridesulfovibrio bastinii]